MFCPLYSSVISPFLFPFLSFMIALKPVIVGNIIRGKVHEDIKMCSPLLSSPPFSSALFSLPSTTPSFTFSLPPSFSPSLPPSPILSGAVFSAGSLFSLRLQLLCWITALYSARDHGVFPVYLFSVPERNAGYFFVLMPSAKEFRRWRTEGGKEGGGVGMPIKLSLPPGECAQTSLTLLHSVFSSLLPLLLIGSRP